MSKRLDLYPLSVAAGWELTGVKVKGTTGTWYVSHEATSRFCDAGLAHSARSAARKSKPPGRRGDAN
jgi:hypothetical protein